MMKISSAFSGKSFEDIKILQRIERIFMEKRGFTFRMPKENEPVILMLSGGLDSVCLWQMLMSRYKLSVYPLYISSNSFIDHQWRSINYFSTLFKEKYPKYFHLPQKIHDRLGMSLTDIIKQQTIGKDMNFIVKNLIFNRENRNYNIGFIARPSRQIRFAFDAYEYAHLLRYRQNISICTIFCAVTKDDTTFMRESTLTVLRSINLSFCLILGDFRWQYTGTLEKDARFVYGRNDLVRFALEKNLPLEKTWSCDKKLFFQCGFCPSCIHRKNTFNELGIADKTGYLPFVGKNKKIFSRKTILRRNSNQDLVISSIPPNLGTKSISIVSGVKLQQIDGKLYLWNKNTGILESVNNTASFLFKLISAEKTVKFEKIIQEMKKKYKISQKDLKIDVSAYIKEAMKKGYLTVK